MFELDDRETVAVEKLLTALIEFVVASVLYIYIYSFMFDVRMKFMYEI
jgi:hypothetical protein